MKKQQNPGRHGRLIGAVAAGLLAGGGLTAVGVGVSGNESPPPPPAAIEDQQSPGTPDQAGLATPPTQEHQAPPDADGSAAPSGPVLAASVPTRLAMPSIDVDSDLMRLGQQADGTLEVPPLDKGAPAGWYRESPTPGEQGPSVLLGHVDSARDGPAVFYRLGDLRAGDDVSVTRADGTVAVFQVDRVETYPKDDFPTLEAYGNTTESELRLITCGGAFDPSSGDYENNVIAYASLASSHSA